MSIRRTLPILLAGIVGTLALAPGTAGAQREPLLIDTTLDYVCAESDPVTVRVTATLPATGVVGEPVEPSHVAVEVSVPASALAALPGAASVTSLARLEVPPAKWSVALSEPVPLADPVVLGGEVTASAVTPDEAGDLAFTAGNLAVSVTGYTADGAPTEPPTVELTCVLAPAEPAELAVVRVDAPAGTGTETPAPTEPRQPREREPGGFAAAAAPPPPECYKVPGVPAEYVDSFCAYLTGYSNIKKLDASVLQPAGIVNIAATKFSRTCAEGTGILCQRALVLPELNGQPRLPPAEGSFFAFGVIPASGTVQLTQVGLADVYLWSTIVRPYRGLTTVKVKLSAQILAADVNGVPIDVGDDCRTVEPIDAVFTGTYDDYSITKGGLLRGTVTIPAFSGCGANEDLDPIFTGLISGPDNFVQLTQGAVCYVTGNNVGCPPVKPEPKR